MRWRHSYNDWLRSLHLTRSRFISASSLRWDRSHEKTRDTWSTADPIARPCGPSWSAKRWCALFSIVFASLVGDDHLVFGSSFYFFRCAVISSMYWLASCQLFTSGLPAIGFVSNQRLYRRHWLESSQCGLDQGHCRRWGRTKVVSERNSLTLCHHHQLRTLADFGFSDCRLPFLAAVKLPLIKVSSPSINLRHTRNQVPSSSQRRHRGQQVNGLGYLSGKSGQPAPERKNQRMPSNSWRLELQGRPGLINSGSRGAMVSHCFSLNTSDRWLIAKTPMNHKIHCIGQPDLMK